MVGLLLPDMTCQLYIIVLRYQVMHSEFPMSRGIVLYYTIGWIAGRLAVFLMISLKQEKHLMWPNAIK